MRNFVKILLPLGFLLTALLHGLGADDGLRRVITITDALGKKVDILCPAQRIVTTNGQAAEIICALGAGDKIVGISNHAAQNKAKLLSCLKGKTTIGHSANPNIEKIVELQPDLVIVYDIWMSKEALEGKLVPLGISVARLCCYRVDTLEEEIAILGKIVGREKKAAEYLQYFRKCLQETTIRLKGLAKRVRIYAESYSSFSTSSKKAPVAHVLECAGVTNIAANQPVRFPKVTSEWVVEENPEVIFKAATPSFVKMGYGADNLQAVINFRKDMLRRPVWDQIEAVKQGRVYLISNEIWSGPRAAVGILYMAKWCYPDRFRDIDPEQVHRQWLRKWHHQELKGIYVYP